MNDIKDDKLLPFFSKHIVPFFLKYSRGEDFEYRFITAFIMSVKNQWFLITAGHCIEDLQELENDNFKKTESLIYDSLGIDRRFKEPNFFVFKLDDFVILNEICDFAYLRLSDYYKELFSLNGIEPLTEEVWNKQPKNVDLYFMLGIPNILTKIDESKLNFSPTIITIERIIERPKDFKKMQVPMFYGKILLDNEVTTIKGMSGGPIFAVFNDVSKGEMRYWLTAIQSTWINDYCFISACPAYLLGKYLETII